MNTYLINGIQKIKQKNKQIYRIIFICRINYIDKPLSHGPTTVSLLSNGELDSLTLGQRNERLGALTKHKNVGQTGDEGVVKRVLDVDNVETSLVSLLVSDDTDTSQVSSSSAHDNISVVELDKASNLSGGQVNLDSVVDLDERVGVTDSATVVGHNVRNTLLSNLDTGDLSKLVLGLLLGDAVDGITSLNVVHETEVLTSLLEGDNVHKTSRVGSVSADLSVNLDQLLHENGLDLSSVESVLQSVTKEHNQRQRLPELVGTSGGSGSVGTRQLVEHPVRGSGKALHVLLWSSSHFSSCLRMRVLKV